MNYFVSVFGRCEGGPYAETFFLNNQGQMLLIFIRNSNAMRSSNGPRRKSSKNPSNLRIVSFIATFCLIIILSIYSANGSNETTKVRSSSLMFQTNDKSKDQEILPADLVESLDAILVLGGGVPSSLNEPPLFAQRRCDVAAAIVKQHQQQKHTQSLLPILALSAGTAHLPQLMSSDGLPIWESTSSAAYLKTQHGLTDNVYVETTSYDTISNAFYARTSFTDITGWKTLLIITNEFHMDRTKVIFDWIFGLQNTNTPPLSDHASKYKLIYLSCDNVGLSGKALIARQNHEQRGKLNIINKLRPQYSSSLQDVWYFLNHKHDFYSAHGLIQRAETAATVSESDSALKESYGAGGGNK